MANDDGRQKYVASQEGNGAADTTRKWIPPLVAIDGELVEMRGEPLDEIWWRGAQWAVTSFGIERLDGCYAIPKSAIEEMAYPWPWHMAQKANCDIDEFTTAWLVALVLHDLSAAMPAGEALNVLRGLERARAKRGE